MNRTVIYLLLITVAVVGYYIYDGWKDEREAAALQARNDERNYNDCLNKGMPAPFCQCFIEEVRQSGSVEEFRARGQEALNAASSAAHRHCLIREKDLFIEMAKNEAGGECRSKMSSYLHCDCLEQEVDTYVRQQLVRGEFVTKEVLYQGISTIVHRCRR